MRERIYYFWMRDEKERAIALAVAATSIFVYGYILNVIVGRDVGETSNQALILGIAILGVWPLTRPLAESIQLHRVPFRVVAVATLAVFIMVSPHFASLLTAREMKRVANLDQPAFSKKLPVVEAVLSAARTQAVSVPPETTAAITSNLSHSDRTQPAFWGVAAALVTYRSSGTLEQLPNCLDRSPSAKLAQRMGVDDTTAKFDGPFRYENCQIELDAPASQVRFRDLVTKLPALEFRHCKIIYHGGRLFFPALADGRTFSLIFTDCVFELHAPMIPSEGGKTLITDLLMAEDLKKVDVQISSA
jgi:hypothetical protein